MKTSWLLPDSKRNHFIHFHAIQVEFIFVNEFITVIFRRFSSWNQVVFYPTQQETMYSSCEFDQIIVYCYVSTFFRQKTMCPSYAIQAEFILLNKLFNVIFRVFRLIPSCFFQQEPCFSLFDSDWIHFGQFMVNVIFVAFQAENNVFILCETGWIHFDQLIVYCYFFQAETKRRTPSLAVLYMQNYHTVESFGFIDARPLSAIRCSATATGSRCTCVHTYITRTERDTNDYGAASTNDNDEYYCDEYVWATAIKVKCQVASTDVRVDVCVLQACRLSSAPAAASSSSSTTTLTGMTKSLSCPRQKWWPLRHRRRQQARFRPTSTTATCTGCT